jgi:hypothetical protein
VDVEHYLQEMNSSPLTTRPHVLVYYRQGRPKALLVGRYEVKRPDLRIGYFQIPAGSVRFLTFPIGALLGDVSASACKHIIDNIQASLAAGEADAATIHHCELASPMAAIARAHAAGRPFGQTSTVQVHRTRMLVDERTSAVIKPSARERKMLKEHRGELRIVCFCSDTELDRLMKDVEAVAAKTYQRGLQVGFADTPQMRERLRFEARMGWLQAYVLYIADRPCAFGITNIYRGIVYCDFLGFDPAYARYSPGIYLMREVIDRFSRESANASVRQIDFGVGEAEYKARFGNQSKQLVSVSMFAPSIRGLTLGGLQTVVGACNAGAERLLAASGLLPRLKRAWRSRLRPRHWERKLSSPKAPTLRLCRYHDADRSRGLASLAACARGGVRRLASRWRLLSRARWQLSSLSAQENPCAGTPTIKLHRYRAIGATFLTFVGHLASGRSPRQAIARCLALPQVQARQGTCRPFAAKWLCCAPGKQSSVEHDD